MSDEGSQSLMINPATLLASIRIHSKLYKTEGLFAHWSWFFPYLAWLRCYVSCISTWFLDCKLHISNLMQDTYWISTDGILSSYSYPNTNLYQLAFIVTSMQLFYSVIQSCTTYPHIYVHMATEWKAMSLWKCITNWNTLWHNCTEVHEALVLTWWKLTKCLCFPTGLIH